MMVGILFVLLILVGALIFFQQTQDGAAGSPAPAELRRWRLQRTRFLEQLAADLQARGLPARADTAGGAVLVSLDALVQPEGAELPIPKAPAVAGLAAALAPAVGCVSVPRGAGATCDDTDLLALDSLSVQVRVGSIPSDPALPRDRAARFLSARLAAGLYEDAPVLLGASDRSGGPALALDGGTIGDGH